MRIRSCIVLFTLAVLAGCKRSPAPLTKDPSRANTGEDVQRDGYDMPRDLEATVLENYLQLALGNMEAYADGIAEDREIMLVGVQPDALVVGTNPAGKSVDRRIFRDRAPCRSHAATRHPCTRVISKRLEVHLYHDDSVGWISDELSYRVPYQGREAAIPIRYTAVMIRDIDRWALVSEHFSYALGIDEILERAGSGKLAKPAGMKTHTPDRGRTPVLKRVLNTRLNADAKAQEQFARARERSRKRAANGQIDLIDEDAHLYLLPGPRQEYRDRDVYSAPSLARFFGNGARITLGDHRLSVAANTRVAWMIANLQVKTVDPKTDSKLDIGLRGTFLFALDDSGWNMVQAHISAPITERDLERRIFGVPTPARKSATERPRDGAKND